MVIPVANGGIALGRSVWNCIRPLSMEEYANVMGEPMHTYVGKCISCFAFFVLNGGVPRLKTMRMNGAVFQVVRARNVCFVCAEG